MVYVGDHSYVHVLMYILLACMIRLQGVYNQMLVLMIAIIQYLTFTGVLKMSHAYCTYCMYYYMHMSWVSKGLCFEINIRK